MNDEANHVYLPGRSSARVALQATYFMFLFCGLRVCLYDAVPMFSIIVGGALVQDITSSLFSEAYTMSKT